VGDRRHSEEIDRPEPLGERPRRPPWTEVLIREALAEFLADRVEWPTYREFQRAGLRSLRNAITRHGGSQKWAGAMGIPYVEHAPGYSPIWTEDRVRRDLRDYLDGRQAWPSRQQFESDGRTLLRNAINRTGGPDPWAREFGLPRSDGRSGLRRHWTDQRIESALRKLIGSGTMWPTRSEFERAGLYSMLTAIYRHEGVAYWAKRMNVQRRVGTGRTRTATWTEQRIRAELQSFCAGRDLWPTEREFIDAGLRAVYSAASRNGGVAYWAQELGLPRRRRPALGRPAPSRPSARQ
jgi:hypothetical protein